MIEKIKISYKTDESENRFFYADIGSETHGKYSFRLWIEKVLVEKSGNDYFITFPVFGAKIIETEKGSLVLRKNDKSTVHKLFVQCGFRGSSDFTILEPPILPLISFSFMGFNACEVIVFKHFKSELGRMGVSKGCLINVPLNLAIKYKWTKSGRLYENQPFGITIINPDGTESVLESVPDELEGINELKEIS